MLFVLALLISFTQSGVTFAYDRIFFEDNNIRWYTGSCEGPTTGCGSKLKVASYNILGKSHTDGNDPDADAKAARWGHWEERIEKVKDTVIREKLDVIGFQEFEPDQNKYLDKHLDGYERSTWGKLSDGIMWNTDRFTKTDQGTWETTYFGGAIDEPWVKLKDNSTDQEFYFMSIHDPINKGKGSPAVRKANAEAHLEEIKRLSDAPVIIVGDFNNGYRKGDGSGMPSDQETAYCILSKGGMTNASDSFTSNDYKCSGNPRPDKGLDIDSRIDHVYMSKEISATEFYDVPKSESGSDHVAVIANLTISGSCGSNANVPDWANMPTSINATPGGPVRGKVKASSVNARAPHTLSAIRTVAAANPDFISLNEAYTTTARQLENAAPGYGAWKNPKDEVTKGSRGQSTNNVILWKKDKWELLDKGQIKITEDDQVVFKGDNKTWDRFAVWGVFKRKTDGAIVPFISTHMMTHAPAEQWGDQPFTRVEQYELGVDILIELVNILSAYGPVLIGGDMNNGRTYDRAWSMAPKMAEIGYKEVHSGVDAIYYPKGTKLVSSRKPYVYLAGDHSDAYIEAVIDMNGVGPTSGGTSLPTSVSSASPNSNGDCTCEEPGTLLEGNDNQEKVWNYLISKGMTNTQAAGSMGNLEHEGGFNPKIVEGGGLDSSGNWSYEVERQFPAEMETIPPPTGPAGQPGYGIVQWTSPGRKDGLQTMADNKGQRVYDLALQLDYMWSELSGAYKDRALDPILASNDLEEVTRIWQEKYEVGANFDPRYVSAQKFLDKYGEGGGSGESSGSTSGSSGSDCGESSGSEFSVDGMTIYNQEDPRWASNPYGTTGKTIKSSGCGPTGMATIITALTGQSVTPDKTAAYATDQGMYVDGAGSSWSLAPTLADHWDLKSKSIPSNVAKVNDELKNGGMVILSGTGAAPFTSAGHFIVIRGVTEDGKWKIADSNGQKGQENSKKEWNPTDILSIGNDNLYAIYK